jgi:hypothetical protein
MRLRVFFEAGLEVMIMIGPGLRFCEGEVKGWEGR